MKTTIPILFLMIFVASCNHPSSPNTVLETNDTLVYHTIKTDTAGKIIPWFSDNLGQSYDTILMLVWNFWNQMETDSNGIKYYLNHQVWKPEHDMRGLGGDQINMALSS